MISSTTGVFKTASLPPLEHGQSRYIMAKNGIYYEQKDDLFQGSGRIHEFFRDVNFGSMELLDHHEFFVPQFPIIPEAMVQRCLGFFKAVEDKWDCECGLVLLYDPATMEYSWCCPEQEISTMDLKFTVPIPGKDYAEHLVHFGDVHLHPGMSAYHSWQDEKDEMLASDGLHLVVGTKKSGGKWDSDSKSWKGEKKTTEFCAVFVSQGARFTVPPESVMELTNKPGVFPPSWLKKCTKKSYVSSYPQSSSSSNWWSSSKSSKKGGGVDEYGYYE